MKIIEIPEGQFHTCSISYKTAEHFPISTDLDLKYYIAVIILKFQFFINQVILILASDLLGS